MEWSSEVDRAIKRYRLDELVPVLVLFAARKLEDDAPFGKTPHDYVNEAFESYLETDADPQMSLIGALCSTIVLLIQRDRDAETAERRRLFRRL